MYIIISKKFIVSLLFFFLFVNFSFSQETDSLSYEPYTAIHYRGAAKIETDTQYHVCQFNFVNVIDSFMYVQLSVAGLEIGRILSTPTHVLFVNKLKKEFYEGDYSVIKKLLDIEIDFYAIQAVLNGFPVLLPNEVELSYKGETKNEEYPFFKTLMGSFEEYNLELDIKKIWFNDVPDVSAAIPKKFSQIFFCDEE